MSRREWRAVSIIILFGFAALLMWLGYRGWQMNGVPAQWVGYLILACGVAGQFGINIWKGGPLDPALDAPESEEAAAIPVDDGNSPVIALSNVEQHGEDTHADIHVQSSWQNRMITVESPAGPPWQIQLPPGIQTGMFLRLHGESIYGPGFLLLRLLVVE